MNKFIQSMQTGDARTENGAITNSTSSNYLLDLFFRGGAMREAPETEILKLFNAAYDQDPELAMKLLFWIRDVRGGAGERRLFEVVYRDLLLSGDRNAIENLDHIPEYGRWKDVIDILGVCDNPEIKARIIFLIAKALKENDQLLGKWLPRKGKIASIIRNMLHLKPKEYRKLIVGLTNVVETKMCRNEWDNIEYKKVPSLAMSRYRNAFIKHDNDRFAAFNNKVLSGEEKINTGAIYPYDLFKDINSVNSIAKINAIEAQWKNLPDYLEDSTKVRFLPVIDVSGSMIASVGNITCLNVAISLGMYIAERNIGDFKDYFMTFSGKPSLEKLTGKTVVEKFKNLRRSEWGLNTNLLGMYKAILERAKRDNIPNSEMPTHILIFSDMEFDEGISDRGITQDIKDMYGDSGYELPNIIYWNIQSRNENIPIKYDESGFALVSGFNPKIVESILGGNLSPIDIMLETITNSRYDRISVQNSYKN